MKRYCQCDTTTGVLRDGLATCAQCGGVDAYKKSPFSMKKEIVRLDAEADRLKGIIREFCAGQEFADKAWREQKHVKPLFDEARYL